MKKRVWAALLAGAIVCASALAGGCAKETESGETLTVFNYGEYLDPEAIEMFTEETGIKILYEEAVTPEDLYTKYKSGAIEYDLLCTSDYMLEKLIQEGELQEIDTSSFEHIGNVGERYFEFSKSFDPENKYTLPYFWGTVGILYNKDKVKGEIDSWEVLFNGDYAGEVIMQNSMRDSYLVALKYLGYSLNTTAPGELKEAQDLLLAQKPDVQAYLVDEVREEMVAENAAVAVIYSGEAYLAHDYNEKLEYAVPKEGSNLWIDAWGVTKYCDNMDAAQKFLDFLCREDVAQMNYEYIYYSTVNDAVVENMSGEEKENGALVPPEEVLADCEVLKQLDQETTDLMNEYWKELKAD